MAINTDPRQTTAYAANRFAPRGIPAHRSIGDLVTPKQAALLLKLSREAGALSRRMMAATDTTGLVTDADVADALAKMTPEAQELQERAMMARTDVYPSKLISSMIDLNRRLTLTVAEMERKHAMRTGVTPAPTGAEDGATYRAPNGAVFHAYKGQQSGRLLLKLWDAEAEVFSYYAAATRLPAGSVKLSTEEMQEFGRATGTCAICMLHLTDDESVARGIGPVCWGKL